MTDPRHPPVFDGHNDAILRLWRAGPARAPQNFADGPGQITVKQAQAGGFAGGLFALFVPSGPLPDRAAFRSPPYDLALPAPIDRASALAAVVGQAEVLIALDRAGLLALCRTAAEIDAAMAAGRIAAVMHLEGAEAIGPDLEGLEVLHAAGLRSLGPVWSRPTVFGHGVPFRHPSDADTGPGLTAAGKALARRCAQLRIVLDTSHLNMRGFWDVAEAGLPLVATHSNCHALAPSARNLTDAQLRAIGRTGGMVGLNFGVFFLRPDGGIAPEGTLGLCVDHLLHMLELAGEDHVGLGSDFDGAPCPPELATAAGLTALRAEMRARGLSEALIAKICHRNWMAFLRRTWGG
ncbi:peptidase M19 [Rhodobacteraceae bacterium 2CG4]|uniref:Peptidase M19 n=1 Tax=Halovulum marinum TaxID=2662447 RepID=A0A6L5YY44_9RHOB|nr:dipeptidase [Halovulum marinum]MSU88745.1 peptidase M19 [Halovulum marinum]